MKYNSRFKYIVDGSQYRLEWILNDQDHPLVMMGDFLDEDQFFAYICKEINAKRFFLRKHAVMMLTDSRITL